METVESPERKFNISEPSVPVKISGILRKFRYIGFHIYQVLFVQ